ncbi:hypothetical protein BDV96DRAFT_569025 [Lophiotrema nucula]|uniref:Uncharacterized protein n=1 Tax=Lophiotrema nucula TaxID=690887 RepID=A0A6A5ZJ74_9PLEO|nr:hypothetical protein BDV96DRAFT_569025 [Lophiotrema nucula]
MPRFLPSGAAGTRLVMLIAGPSVSGAVEAGIGIAPTSTVSPRRAAVRRDFMLSAR